MGTKFPLVHIQSLHLQVVHHVFRVPVEIDRIYQVQAQRGLFPINDLPLIANGYLQEFWKNNIQ